MGRSAAMVLLDVVLVEETTRRASLTAFAWARCARLEGLTVLPPGLWNSGKCRAAVRARPCRRARVSGHPPDFFGSPITIGGHIGHKLRFSPARNGVALVSIESFPALRRNHDALRGLRHWECGTGSEASFGLSFVAAAAAWNGGRNGAGGPCPPARREPVAAIMIPRGIAVRVHAGMVEARAHEGEAEGVKEQYIPGYPLCKREGRECANRQS